MTQATAELNETATADISDEQLGSDMNVGFAHDVQETHPTTTPAEPTEASATPDTDDASTG